ncbi:hypothetical protein [Sphingopyxis sp. GC21]|uniref:hypothetical protein n=1 Tax=Sphingopyxis sp. GC21 TaxID=2933562 RepID=UPI0021E379D4|nr:hypothetical protein [Sphingopyxis sp. GC21]
MADIERDELTGIYPEIEADVRALTADVDQTARRVLVRYRGDMPRASRSGPGGTAAWRCDWRRSRVGARSFAAEARRLRRTAMAARRSGCARADPARSDAL